MYKHIYILYDVPQNSVVHTSHLELTINGIICIGTGNNYLSCVLLSMNRRIFGKRYERLILNQVDFVIRLYRLQKFWNVISFSPCFWKVL